MSTRTDRNLDAYQFTVRLLSKEERGGYLVEYPDIPGCMSDGATIAEAIANGREALRHCVAVFQESGRKVPKPGIEAAQWRQRLPRTLYSKLTVQAVSIASWPQLLPRQSDRDKRTTRNTAQEKLAQRKDLQPRRFEEAVNRSCLPSLDTFRTLGGDWPCGELTDAYYSQRDPCGPLTRAVGGHPVWTRLEFARETGITSRCAVIQSNPPLVPVD